jgi:hypothetical protein
VAQLSDILVAADHTLTDDFVERVGEMPQMLPYAHGTTVELDPVVLPHGSRRQAAQPN